MEAGDDGDLIYLQAGYLLPFSLGSGRLQPYLRYETVSVDQKNNTNFWSGGFNFFVDGHNGKISFDYTLVKFSNTNADQGIITFQIATGL